MLLPSSFLTFYGNVVVSYHNISADYFPQAKNVVYLFLNWVCIPFSILNSLRFRSGYVQRNPDFFISRLSRPAELVGARPLHLLTQTARRLKRIFTRRAETGRCSKISFVVGLYGPLREKAESERPQSFQFCKNKNNFPLNMARACGGHFKSSNYILNRRYPRHAAHRKIL